jgi:putative ABC transport system permease protein
MISPRWMKVARDVWSNKTRTILVVMSIAVGVFAVGTTLTIQDVLAREMDRNWQASNPASLRVGIGGFQQDFVTSIRQMPEVAEAEGRSSIFIRARAAGTEDFKYIELLALNDFNDVRVNTIEKADVAAADWPPAKRDVILGANSLAFLSVKVGDTLELQNWNGKKYAMRVAGTAYSVDEGGGPFIQNATGYVTFDTWEWLDQSREFDTLLVRVAERTTDRDYIQEVGDTIRDRVQRDGKAFQSVRVPQEPGKHPISQTVTGIVALMTAIGIASLIMSGFLVINTVSAVLAQHVRQIGMMKAVGARTGQLGRMYFGMVLVFGFLSLFVAVPLGILGGRYFVKYLGESLLNLKISSFLPPTSVFAIQIAIGLIAPLIAALAPVFSGTRKTVRDALSDYGMSGGGKVSRGARERRGLFARLPLRSSAPVLSRPLIISLRNTFRRKGRLMMTLITLVLGGAIFIGVMSARDGLTRTTDLALAYWNYDMDVSLTRDYPAEQIEREALAVPGVTRVESWGFANARRQLESRVEGSSFLLVGPPAETDMLKPILRQGRWLTVDDVDAVVLNTDVLENEKDNGGIELGDVVNVKINGTFRANLKVVGLVQGVLTGPIGYINRPSLAKITGAGNKFGTLVIGVDTKDAVEQANIAKAIEEHFKRVNLNVNNTSLTSATRTAINAQFSIIIYLLMAMAVLLAVVGGLGLAGTMSINVMERTREIGVMRAIGASNGSIRTIVVIEGMVIGVLSWIVGALLSLPFSLGINALLTAALRFEVFYAFSVLGLLSWLAIVIGIATIASVLPAWNASRLTVREVLAYG